MVEILWMKECLSPFDLIPLLFPPCAAGWSVRKGLVSRLALHLLCKDDLELLLLLPPLQGKDYSCVPQRPASNLRHFYFTWITLIQCRTYIHDWFFWKKKNSKCGRPHSKKKWILKLVIQESPTVSAHSETKRPHLAPSIGVSVRRILTDY